MPAERFVPLVTLIQFTGSNAEELPLSNYVDACGPGTGLVTVEDGVLTITWAPQFAQTPVTIQTGDWLDQNGIIYSAATVTAGFVRLADLGDLL